LIPDSAVPKASASPATTIAPWLSVRKSAQAVEFYKAALGAVEVYRLDDPDANVIARLSIDGAEFWVGDESPQHFNFSPASLNGSSVRIILTVADPDALFERAVKAGASQVYAVNEAYGWRVGRVVDPYGHHWEIGRPLEADNA
jgi:PhnB protein